MALATAPGTTSGTAGTITERAMLTTLSISQWSAKKTDKKVSREVAVQHNAGSDSGNYNKKLVDKDGAATQALVALQKIATEARTIHRELTLPWFDDGTRILPSAMYFRYTSAMSAIEDKWQDALPAFVAAYPQMVNEAQRSLNGLFDPADYPPVSKIQKRFTLGYHIIPLPDKADFRIDVGDAEVARISAQLEAGMQAVFQDAVKDVYERIFKTVGHMAEKLRGYKGTKEGSFRDSLVENVRELVDMLPSLNVMGDAGLASVTAQMRDQLTKFDGDTLRASDNAREKTAQAAEAILATVSEFMA